MFTTQKMLPESANVVGLRSYQPLRKHENYKKNDPESNLPVTPSNWGNINLYATAKIW